MDGSKIYYGSEREKNQAIALREGPGWRAHAYEGARMALGPVIKFSQLAARGIYHVGKYMRNFYEWGHVGERGYGVLQRGQAVHPDLTIKKEMSYLAEERRWPEYWRHAEGMGKTSDVKLPDARLIQLRRMHLLRKRRRYWKKSRYLKGKKRRSKRY